MITLHDGIVWNGCYFLVKKAANDQYMVNLRASNNQVLLTSETYIRPESLVNALYVMEQDFGQTIPIMYDRPTNKRVELLWKDRSLIYADTKNVFGTARGKNA